jgi:hypothetical protein
MALVAVSALCFWAIPPWWRWHDEMLRRSKRYLRGAESCEIYALRLEAEALRLEGWAKNGEPYDIVGTPATTLMVQGGRRETMKAREEMGAFRRAAVLPWLGFQEPATD